MHSCYELGWTKGVPRFYMFSEDLASAYMLRHQMSTVLKFQARDRRRFGGLDEEFEGQSMSISDWETYMRFGMYKYWRESCQGNENWAHIRVRVQGMEIEQGEWKCKVKQKHETKRSLETWNAKGDRIWGWMSKQSNCDDGWTEGVSVPCTYFHIMLPLEHDILYILNDVV